MNSMRSRVFLFCFWLLLSGCNGTVRNPTNQDPNRTAVNNWNSSLEQIKNKTLDKACDNQMRAYYKGEIERQSKYLNPAQLEKSMKNMQEDMVCK